jgi:uncharacterized protein (TIGR03000 family)
MNAWSRRLQKYTLAMAALLLMVAAASAQSTNPYPYWDSAPSSYRGSNIDAATRPMPAPPSDPFGPTYWPGSRVGPGWLSPRSWSYSYLANIRSRGLSGWPLDATGLSEESNKAHISLAVPADAQVWFDGKATRLTGTRRTFASPPLTPGRTYTYTLRVRWMNDGTPVEENRSVQVHAGAWVRLNLTP